MIRSIYNDIVERIAFGIFSEEREEIIDYLHQDSELDDEENLNRDWVITKMWDYLEYCNRTEYISGQIDFETISITDGMEIISDVGIEDALRIYVNLNGDIDENHIPTEKEIVKSVLNVIYYPKTADILVKLADHIMRKYQDSKKYLYY